MGFCVSFSFKVLGLEKTHRDPKPWNPLCILCIWRFCMWYIDGLPCVILQWDLLAVVGLISFPLPLPLSRLRDFSSVWRVQVWMLQAASTLIQVKQLALLMWPLAIMAVNLSKTSSKWHLVATPVVLNRQPFAQDPTQDCRGTVAFFLPPASWPTKPESAANQQQIYAPKQCDGSSQAKRQQSQIEAITPERFAQRIEVFAWAQKAFKLWESLSQPLQTGEVQKSISWGREDLISKIKLSVAAEKKEGCCTTSKACKASPQDTAPLITTATVSALSSWVCSPRFKWSQSISNQPCPKSKCSGPESCLVTRSSLEATIPSVGRPGRMVRIRPTEPPTFL